MRQSSCAATVFVICLIALFARLTSAAEDTTKSENAAACVGINPGVPWPAVDNLDRVLPAGDQVPALKKDRFVGIFYFLWLDRHGPKDQGPYDVSKILAANPHALEKRTSPPWGPVGAMHFWGEPLYGYYHSADPWVLRRHAHLLADAGVDTLIFDATNAVTYRDVYMKLCEVFTQVRREGGRTPQIAFMLNSSAGQTAKKLYEELYKPGLYRDLWFVWEGKPLLICDPAKADDEVNKFFTLRRAHWPFTQVDTPYAWHWEATYPQHYGYTTDAKKPEQVNVSVAQNLRQSDGQVTMMSDGNARGRSFHNKCLDTRPASVDHGHNFQEQWTRAHELQPPFVMVTGWNEWIATYLKRAGNPLVFCDQFDQQCSRDIEPAKCSHADNYYYQLVANVRRYKGMTPLPTASGAKTIRLEGGFEQWQDVLSEFRDGAGDTTPRDHKGTGKTHYKNNSGRNELLLAKVARDEKNVYFYVRTRKPISSHKDPCWMNLLIDVDADHKTGWRGFDFIVNRSVASESKTTLERNADGFTWKKAADVQYRVTGNEMQIVVPRAALGLAENTTSLRLDFKWVDNWQKPGDVLDFYTSGDVAPDGRFKYRYVAE